MHMKNEYFQNDVIDLRILGDIGSVCIYRFPYQTDHNGIMFPIAPCIVVSTNLHNNTHKKLNSVFQGVKKIPQMT